MRGVPARRAPVPDAVRRAPVAAGEKVLAWTESTDGAALAGTRDALYVGDRRIPWEEVEAAEWDRDTSTFRVSEVGRWGETRVEHALVIEEPRKLLELVRERLKNAGFAAQAGRRVVLTGGASQLVGLPETARRILQGQVRVGRPLGIKGLPEAAKGPAFSAVVGLLVYPQVAHVEYFERSRTEIGPESSGYLRRVGRWVRESF